MTAKRRNGATKVAKTRISITMTRPYMDALDSLVKQGIYLSRGDIILESLRRFFRDTGVNLPYYKDA